MQRSKQDRWRRQRGQGLLETALMIVIIFTVMMWVFEIGQLMYTYTVMADAANEGVRYAIVHSGADVAGTTARVKNSEERSRGFILEKKGLPLSQTSGLNAR